MKPKQTLCIISTSLPILLLLLATVQGRAKPADLNTAKATAPAARPNNGQFVNWYPSSIALPQGLNYPCALTPLPTALPGIPADDRNYLNHVYSMLLKCVQAKTIMLSKLKRGEAASAYTRY